MSRRLYFLTVDIIAKRLINEDFYARATKTVKGWRILLIHHCVVPLPSQGKAVRQIKILNASNAAVTSHGGGYTRVLLISDDKIVHAIKRFLGIILRFIGYFIFH